MMRRSLFVLAAAAAPAAAPAAAAASAANSKMAALHKILTGEVQFRNNAGLKVCNIEHSFGPNWRSEIEAYAKTLPAEPKALLERQIARVLFTRYTTRELAQYAGEGAQYLDSVAQAANVQQGKAYLQKNGAEKFEAYVKEAAQVANWSDADAKKFIDAVKSAK